MENFVLTSIFMAAAGRRSSILLTHLSRTPLQSLTIQEVITPLCETFPYPSLLTPSYLQSIQSVRLMFIDHCSDNCWCQMQGTPACAAPPARGNWPRMLGPLGGGGGCCVQWFDVWWCWCWCGGRCDGWIFCRWFYWAWKTNGSVNCCGQRSSKQNSNQNTFTQ